MNRTIRTRDEEASAFDAAEAILDKLEALLPGASPEDRPRLQRLVDRSQDDLDVWSRALRRGIHTTATAASVARLSVVLKMLDETLTEARRADA